MLVLIIRLLLLINRFFDFLFSLSVEFFKLFYSCLLILFELSFIVKYIFKSFIFVTTPILATIFSR